MQEVTFDPVVFVEEDGAADACGLEDMVNRFDH